MGFKSTLAWAAMLFAHTAMAAEVAVPSAGQSIPAQEQLERPVAPPSPPQLPESPIAPTQGLQGDDQRVIVNAISLEGNAVFSQEALQALAQDRLPRAMTLTEMQQLAERITQHYKAHGFGLARAYLPADNLANGVLRILIIEGHLGAINLSNRSRLSDAQVRALLHQETTVGQTVNTQALERYLLLLSDLTPLEKATLHKGSLPGTTDLDLQLGNKPAWVRASLDNFGSKYIGEYRAGLEFVKPNLIDRGDELSGIMRMSDQEFSYGRLTWKTPIGNHGTSLGLSASASQYELGSSLRVLHAHGEAQTASLSLNHPFVRSPSYNLSLGTKVEWKFLKDRIDLIQDAVDKRAQKWQLGLSTDVRDRWGGYTRANLNWMRNHLMIDTADDLALDNATLHTAGTASIWQMEIDHAHPIMPTWSWSTRLETQYANRNLDIYDKMILGGASKMRAYPLADALGDDGVYSKIALHHRLGAPWQVSVFYEAATLRINHNANLGSDNISHLQDAGIQLQYQTPAWDASASLAWRTGGDSPETDSEHSPRIWVDAGHYF